jgi:hypothetical protein
MEFKIDQLGVQWIDLVQDTDTWQFLVNTVMNLWAP